MQQLPYVPARGIFRKLSERAFEHAGKDPSAPTVPKLFELAEKTPEFYRHFNQKVKKIIIFFAQYRSNRTIEVHLSVLY